MKKTVIFSAVAAAVCALVSCEEFEPVLTMKYDTPEPYAYVTAEEFGVNATIKDIAATYTHGSPHEMTGGKRIHGRVSTTDQPGNFYKSLYIQDETGGMEIKIGKNGLYNDFKEGQEIFIDCDGLFIGEYGSKTVKGVLNSGMVHIGYDGTGTDYETSYIEVPLIIYSHIFRGDPGDLRKVTPKSLAESELPGPTETLATNPYIGTLVTLKGLTYGWHDPTYDEDNEAFVLFYINSQLDKKNSANRIFVSGTGTGITSWALSKEKMDSCLTSGMWDDLQIGNSGDQKYGVVSDRQYKNLYIIDKGDELQKAAIEQLKKGLPTGCVATINTVYSSNYKIGDKEVKTEEVSTDKGTVTLRYVETYPGIERAAGSVSQYFTFPGTTKTGVQVRTSGFCKFADAPVDPAVLSGSRTVDVTGVLTLYQGKLQITVNSLNDIKVN